MMARWAAAMAATALVASAASAQIPQARVTGGTVAGAVTDGLSIFKGIPFAAPAGGRSALEGAAAGESLAGRAPDDRVRRGLHAESGDGEADGR